MNFLQEYKFLSLTLSEIQEEHERAKEQIVQMRKIPRCQGELHRFNMKHKPFEVKYKLQGEIFKLNKKIDYIEKSIVGYDISPKEENEFLKDFEDFFKEIN